MKPSEVIRNWMMDPAYDPEGERSLFRTATTQYLCNVSINSGLAEGMVYEDAKNTRILIEAKLQELAKLHGRPVGVLNHHFEHLGEPQTLENSREFWETFAKELEAKGL